MMRQSLRLVRAALLLAPFSLPRSAQAEVPPAFTYYEAGKPQVSDPLPEDPVPIMVTYEFKRQREAERIIQRNPKRFWVRQIMTRIEASRLDLPKPPDADRVVRLNFVVARDGRLVSKSVITSSGSPVVDKTAMTMLDRAQPFPPMPPAMDGEQQEFNLPVRFR